MDLQTIAVMLQLMRPTRTCWRFLGDSRLTGMDESSRRVRWPAARVTPQHAAHIAWMTPEKKAASEAIGGSPCCRSSEVVKTFRDELLTNLSRPLARKVLVSLKTMLKTNDYAHVGASVTIKKDKRQEHQLEVGKDIPTPAEIKRMVVAATETRARALLLLAAFTGLRSSELRGLRWSDINLSGELHVRQRADKYYQIGAPK